MPITKGVLKSKTIWGAIITSLTLIVFVLNSFGVSIIESEANDIMNHLDTIVTSVIAIWGIVQTIIGRMKAESQIKGFL